jgi:hypothetical protein
MESDHSASRVAQEVAAGFEPNIHAAKNVDRVILRAYRTLSLQLLAHNRGDFARLVMAR